MKKLGASAFNDGSVCCYIWTKYDNFCKITKSCKTVWIRNHGAVYSNSDRNIYDSKSMERGQKYLILLVCMIMQNFVNSLKVHWQRKCQLLLRARRR